MNFLSLFKRNLLFKFKKKINVDLEDVNSKDKTLEELFSYYNTDKANYINNNEQRGHGFSKFYEKHLNHFKKKEKIKILELGSYSGASACAFLKYFPNSEIYCFDINLLNFKYSSKKIHVYGVNSSDHNKMNKLLSKINFYEKIKYFDIIIDDGSHIQSDQLLNLEFFSKLVSKDGFYIIEDYKFPKYFNHLNDVEDLRIDELISKIRKKENFSSSFISENTIKDIGNNFTIYEYSGNKEYSDIAFFEKKIIS